MDKISNFYILNNLGLQFILTFKHLQKNNESLRFSIRVDGSVTSISLRRNVVSLWLLFSEITKDKQEAILTFIYDCIDKWENTTAKGLSSYILETMIKDILESDDFRQYQRIYNEI